MCNYHTPALPLVSIHELLTHLSNALLSEFPHSLTSANLPSLLGQSYYHSNVLLSLPPSKIPLRNPLLTPAKSAFLYHLIDKLSWRRSLYSLSLISLFPSSHEPVPTRLLFLYTQLPTTSHLPSPTGKSHSAFLLINQQYWAQTTSSSWELLLHLASRIP